jgi:hypothetical protein
MADKFEEALRFTGEVGQAFEPHADAALIEETSQNHEGARAAYRAHQLALRQTVQQLTDTLRGAEGAARRPRSEDEHRAEVAALAARRDALHERARADGSDAAALGAQWAALDTDAAAVQAELDRVACAAGCAVPALQAKARLYAAATNLVWTRPSCPGSLAGFVVFPALGDARSFEIGPDTAASPVDRADLLWSFIASPPSSPR